MASTYPGALDTLATTKANATTTFTDHPNHHNDMADAINKIEAELGTNPRGASATVAARLLSIEQATRELSSVERTTGLTTTQTVTASADVFLTSATLTYDGATRIRIDGFVPEVFNSVVTNYNNLYLFEDGSAKALIGRKFSPSTTQGNSMFGSMEFVPTAASHTYSLRISVSSGTGTFNAGVGSGGGFAPAFIRIIRV